MLMNILAIGNSFSEDATRYLHGIARADGVQLSVINLFITGCPLDNHIRRKTYAFLPKGKYTKHSVELSLQALRDEVSEGDFA